MTQGDAGWTIIAGAGGAIGRAIFDRFAGRQGSILALDRNVDDLKVTDRSARIAKCAVDLTVEADVKAAIDKAIPTGERINLLINAVGLIWNEPVLTLRGASLQPHGAAAWRQVLEANLTAPFIVSSLIAARMARKRGGCIINFSSIAGRGNVGQAAYSAAKAGVEGMTRSMAAELGPLGIRVNAVAPGFIDVYSTHAAMPDKHLAKIVDQTPLKRLGQLDELLDAVDFLANNAFISGAVLDVNGGLRL
jgi:3-oxoacyl-[acyl-carrier protein] reductase